MKYRPAVVAAAASVALLAGTPAAGAAEDGLNSLPACTDVSTAYGDYEQHDLKASLDIVADEMVPGGDWSPAKGTVTNVGKRDLAKFGVSAYAWLQTDNPELQDLTKWVKVEVRTADGTWQPVNGTDTIDSTPLPAGQTRSYDLRIRVTKDVSAELGGPEFNFTGTFADVYRFPDTGKEVECAAEAIGYDAFHIRRATTTPKPTPSSARPTPTASQASPTPTATPTSAQPTASPSTTSSASASASASPTSTASAAPVPVPASSSADGELAATGGSDATLPLAAAAGGLAVLGAGAVVFARRRRG
ncbi:MULTISPECIES: LPXTG cell wall anchor domain-containing protein [Streptomyces]|uniref:LPXTG cell wall anchor domain-containing protein n=1 Tax=Streptomyces eurythermus TaxID=42237 RepID=A0ABW6YMV5_9ACTN|nr:MULTISPECIES: LPXTG cell wall anchor domain-containing protein [Streptomyces]QIS71335.1 LPXTG cell wall anchor domain-containing protein [Streptomyces sp. DSM 40868]